jgi:hypothetical protein
VAEILPAAKQSAPQIQATNSDTNENALILAIIAKETGFRPDPINDHGPIQLIAWVKNYYQYFDDGALKYAGDQIDNRYDRAMQYDQVGRLGAAQTGTEARGGTTADGPFNQTYQYDAFNHTTARTSSQWSTTFTDSGTYQNERHNGWSYDTDGNVTNNSDVQFIYDAAGQPAQTVNVQGGSISGNSFDGDGRRIKSAFQLNQSYAATTKYYLRATPLGSKVVADILSSGEKVQGYVYSGGELMAVQRLPVTGDVSNYVVWQHEEPSGSVRASDPTGNPNWITDLNSAELDATGADMKTEDPGNELLSGPDENNPDFPATGNPTRLSGGCTFNGMPIADCGFLLRESFFDHFSLVEVAAKASTRIVGYRYRRVPSPNVTVTIEDAEDDSPDFVRVNHTEEKTPIYAQSWNFSSLLTLSQPQNPSPGSFQDCFHRSGLATTHVKGQYADVTQFAQDAANLLLDIHNAEGGSSSLLAVTLMNENTTFDLKLGPNTNRSKNTERWDVGPFQINQHYTNIAIKKGAVSMDGLDYGGVYGMKIKANEQFYGDPLQNGQMAARILGSNSGTDRNKAMMYTAQPSRAVRGQSYDSFAPLFDWFFNNCYRR